MRKVVLLFLALLLSVGVALPPLIAAVAAAISWHTADCKAAPCPADTEGEVDYSVSGTGAMGSMLFEKIVCTGSGCTQTSDVFYEISGSLVWSHYVDYGTRYAVIEVRSFGGYKATHRVACLGPLAGSCSWHLYGMIPKATINPDPGAVYHIEVWLGMDPNATYTEYAYSMNITLAGDPINTDDCDEYLDEASIASGTLSPTDEDGDLVTLVVGQKYRVTISGGPWHPPTGDRYDAAAKIGTADWLEIANLAGSDAVECAENDPEDVNVVSFVLEATDVAFRIRVNDLAGAFADNTGSLDYSVTSVTTLGGYTNCAGQYLLGDLLGTIALSSQNAAGANLSTALGSNLPQAGAWMAIRVASGSWQNQGSGAALTSMALKQGIGGTWWDLDVNPTTGCADEDTDTYYIQLSASNLSYFLRVADDDVDFPSNTGTLTVNFYAISAYTPFPSGCELNYVIGDFIETGSVRGDMGNGLPIDHPGREWDPYGGAGDYVAPKRFYMLETFGGPVGTGGGNYTYDADLGLRDSQSSLTVDEWHFSQTAPFVECAVTTDLVGHVKVFFAIDEQVDLYEFIRYWFAFRARDTGSYADNTGSLSYRLYMATDGQVIDPGTVPETDGCIQFSHEVTAASSTTILGVDADGSRLGTSPLVSGTMYAIVVEAGPWEDDGTASYRVQVTSDDGDEWFDLEDYPYLLCSQSADGDHYTIYVQAATGQLWRARVDDGNSDFADNSDSIRVAVYPGLTSIDPWPTCENDYQLSYVGQLVVPGNIEDGRLVTITAGRIYSLIVTGEAMWYDDGGATGSYLLQITSDGGATWTNLEEFSGLCTQMVGNNGLFQVFFTGAAGQYRLRVQDDADFPGNTGSVVVELYSAEDITNPGGEGQLPPDWVVACDEIQDRPDSVIEWFGVVPVPRVAAWIDYLRYTIVYYFAWCPEHTEALEQIGAVYLNREPLASIFALRDLVVGIQTSLEAYTVAGGESDILVSQEPDLFSDADTIGQPLGGANSWDTQAAPVNPLDLFVVGNINMETNPWFGGDLVLSSAPVDDMDLMDDYRDLCQEKFYSMFGVTTTPYCYFMGFVRYSKAATWILLIVDILIVIWWLLSYFPGWLRRIWETVTGEKKTVSKIAGRLTG